MAPGFYITQGTPTGLEVQPTYATESTFNVNGQRLDYWDYQMRVHSYEVKKKFAAEPKKEKIKRVAKEKMYASWKTIDRKTETINIVKQICKPRHQMAHIGGRMR
jgi:hypothetical protein